jgi:elongation factor P
MDQRACFPARAYPGEFKQNLALDINRFNKCCHELQASYLYRDGDGSHFLDQESYETLTLDDGMMGNALDFLIEGALIQLHKYNGNPIGLVLPMFVELSVVEAEPAARGDFSSGSGTKMAKLETGLTIRVPPFIKEGEKVKVSTENGEFAGRA